MAREGARVNMTANPAEYSIVHEPCGATYRQLLRFGQSVADTALLVVRDPEKVRPQLQAVLGKLEPFLLSSADESQWPGTRLIGHTARVYRYRFTDQCLDVLSSSVDRLYEWLTPLRPEDLCLLRKGTPFLTTIAHERTAFLELTPDEHARIEQEVPELKLFLGDFMPDSKELYRLFSAFLDDYSFECGASVDSALAGYVANAYTSAERLDEAISSLRGVVSVLKDDAILRVVIERFGGGKPLLVEPSSSSVLLRIADQIESLRRTKIAG